MLHRERQREAHDPTLADQRYCTNYQADYREGDGHRGNPYRERAAEGLGVMGNVESYSLLRLRVVAEADAGALMRVLERFQNLGILPRRVIAEFTTSDSVSIQLDVAGLEESRLSLIAAKLGELPFVTQAYWHYAS